LDDFEKMLNLDSFGDRDDPFGSDDEQEDKEETPPPNKSPSTLQKNKVSDQNKVINNGFIAAFAATEVMKTIKVPEEIIQKKKIKKEKLHPYARLVGTVYYILNISGIVDDLLSAGPDHIFQLFEGDIPPSFHKKWITDKSDLLKIVKESCKQAFKITLDAFSIYDLEFYNDLPALEESLITSVKSCIIGDEGGKVWSDGISIEHPQFFNLRHSHQSGYGIKTLNLQEQVANVGILERQVS
jgi:hypothetical protein